MVLTWSCRRGSRGDELADDGPDHGGIALVGHVGVAFQDLGPGVGEGVGRLLCRLGQVGWRLGTGEEQHGRLDAVELPGW